MMNTIKEQVIELAKGAIRQTNVMRTAPRSDAELKMLSELLNEFDQNIAVEINQYLNIPAPSPDVLGRAAEIVAQWKSDASAWKGLTIESEDDLVRRIAAALSTQGIAPAPVGGDATIPEHQPVSAAEWTSADILPLLEYAMQLKMSQADCDCDRSKVNACSGICVGSRIWGAIHRARKLIRATEESDPN